MLARDVGDECSLGASSSLIFLRFAPDLPLREDDDVAAAPIGVLLADDADDLREVLEDSDSSSSISIPSSSSSYPSTSLGTFFLALWAEPGVDCADLERLLRGVRFGPMSNTWCCFKFIRDLASGQMDGVGHYSRHEDPLAWWLYSCCEDPLGG